VEVVQREFAVVEKSAKATSSGSVTPWQAGGISPYQFEHGRLACEAAGHRYESYGATPPADR
jgi:hypothetical protein